MRFNRLRQNDKALSILALVLVVLDLLLASWCVIEHESCCQWEATRDRLEPYRVAGRCPAIEEKHLVLCLASPRQGDSLEAVQTQATRQGLILTSVEMNQSGEQLYRLEMKGSYRDFILFLNEIEGDLLLAAVQLQDMTPSDEGALLIHVSVH